MVTMNLIRDLYQHMEWADATVWTAALATPDAQADARLREYFYHLHLVQYAFLRVWRGEPRDLPYPTFEDALSVREWGQAYYAEVFAHLDTFDEEKLAEPLSLPWADMVEKQLGRPPEVSTLGETALQVSLHSLYHRGQINARLREIGGKPPLADYIAWIWLGRPVAAWPSDTAT